MKKLILAVVLIFLVLPSITTAQQNKLNNYKKFDYIKVNNTEIDAFLQFSENNLKKAIQELINAGTINSWALYKLEYPGGKKSGYNFVSIVTGTDINAIQSAFSNIKMPSFAPNKTAMSQTEIKGITTHIKSELWKVENSIAKNNADELPSKYATLDYMDVAPGKSPDYLMLEDEIAKPIHQERINQDIMAGWQVYSLIIPSGTEYGYNFSTFNSFDQLGDVEFGFTSKIISQTMGENADVAELFNTIYDTRDLVKVELLKLVNHANN